MAESQLARGPTLAAPQGAAGERLAPGAAAGDYVVDGFLGAGAMGEVYAGRHPVIGKRVAIKVLKRELASSAEAAERFVREARAVNQVNHPNVIDVFGFGRLGDGRLYLVMDLVEGRSLRKAVQDNLLDVPATLDVLAQIAGALDAAHARGVVHRDLKPDNVMIDDATPAKVYVLDFGIAKLVTEGGALGNGTLTGQGAWLGTPGYMAPEQWSSDGAGPASDRYALGVMAFELLSGKLPFQAQSLPQMMEQHFRAPVPALTARGAAPSNATFDPVLSRAMAKDPGQRYATAAELVEALRAAAGTGPRRGIATFPRRMWTLWIPAAAGAGVLGLAVVAVIAARDDGGAPADPASRARASTPPPPAGGLARVDVLTRPAGATVKRDGRLLGATPASFDVRLGERVELEIAKPGYATVHRVLDAAAAVGPAIDVALEPQNGFEGVWALPDGQLRAFARAGEDVHVFKLATVNGEREFYRKLALEDAPAGEVMLVATETMADARASHDASCQIAHRIEYHYQTATDALDVRPENIETAVRDGRCIVVRKEPGRPMLLVRADHAPGDTRWSHAPVGVPQKETRLPNDTFDNPADVNQKTIPIDDKAAQQQRDAAAKKAKLARPAKLPPAPKNAPKSVLTNAPDSTLTSAKDPPPPTTNAEPQAGEVKNQTVPNAPGPQAPQPQAPQPQAPQQVLPRGDSQVAPQVQGQDTGTQQQRPVKPSRKK